MEVNKTFYACEEQNVCTPSLLHKNYSTGIEKTSSRVTKLYIWGTKLQDIIKF
jgi:hypothetical protein